MQVTLLQSSDMKMSSKEIAELTGKDPKNVIRDIRTMLDQIDGSVLSHEQYQELKDNRGYTSEFLLNHDLSVLLITGYDVNARLKVIKRWKELEAKQLEASKVSLAILDKRATHHPMMNALIEHREEQGKKTMNHHFIIENKLCNWSVTGSFDAIDETQLTIDEMQLLAYARRTNESLIMVGIDYDERKRLLAYKVENKRRKIQKLLSN